MPFNFYIILGEAILVEDNPSQGLKYRRWYECKLVIYGIKLGNIESILQYQKYRQHHTNFMLYIMCVLGTSKYDMNIRYILVLVDI